MMRALVRAREAVYRLLKFRNRSEKEIRERLAKKNFSPDIIETTITYFREMELLDDRQFAREWIRSRLKKPFGTRRIRMELKQKGVGADIIAEEIAATAAEQNEDDVVLDLATERFSRYAHLDKPKRKRRLFEYLARRGFQTGSIVRAIHQLERRQKENK